MKPQVSVIIPTLNEERHIKTCLQSIKNQNTKAFEIIVVDNFSKDKTTKIVQNFTSKCFQKGPERSSQRNFGAEKAKGDWLLFLDADQKAPKNLIGNFLLRIYKNPKIKALIIAERVDRNGFWSKCRDLEKKSYFNDDTIETARFFEKNTFKKIGGYDEKLVAGEDWDLTSKLREKGYKIERLETPLVNFEKITLGSSLRKKFYYGTKIGKYISKHPKTAKKQLSFSRSALFFKNLNGKNFIYVPGLLLLKILEFLAGGIGFIYSKTKK